MKQRKKTIELYNSLRLRDDFIAGDSDAYSQLYRMYAHDLYAFGLSLRAKTSLIEDAIHDVFEEIYTHKENLKNVDNLKFYFIIAFRNRLFFLLKRELNTTENMESAYFKELTERNQLDIWIEQETDQEKQQLIKKLMDELNDNQREAIYYRFIEGLSLDEISSLMNINYQSVKNLIYRSIKKMNSLRVTTYIMLISISIAAIIYNLQYI